MELVGADTQVQKQVRRDTPVVLQIDRLCLGLNRCTGDVAARVDDAGDAGGDRGSIERTPGHRRQQGVADAISRIHHVAVGRHDFLVRAEAQQVITQRPLEINARRFALVKAAVDPAVGGVAPFLRRHGPELGRVATATRDGAAVRIPGAATGGATLIHAIHRLGDEVVREVARVRYSPVVATSAGEALAVLFTPRGAIPVVFIAAGGRVRLVREGQHLQQVVVVDLPIKLGAPEVVVAVAVQGFGCVDIARIGVALFVHSKEEQPVLHDGTGCPDVGLGERRVVPAPAILLHQRPVPVKLVLP